MIQPGSIAIPLVVALIAAALRPALALGDRARRAALIIVGVPTALLPLLIAPDHRLERGIAAIICGTFLVKLYDLHVSRLRGRPVPAWRRYALFLIGPLSLVERRLDDQRLPGAQANLRAAACGFAILLVAGSTWFALDLDRLGERSFLLEHAVKTIIASAALYAIAGLFTAAWFSLKLPGREWMRFFFAARTPAEFWRLYNCPAGQLCYEDVFLRIGGLHAPVRATLLAFAWNGLLHEYIAFMAIGAVQGYQTAFFLIQGAAVAATMRLRPKGPAAALGVALTLAFNLGSSLLFFATANQMITWYSDAAPAWMKPR